MNASNAAQNYIIQLDLPNGRSKKSGRLDMKTVLRLFDGTGIELDANYGPILINPQERRFVVRGLATSESRQRAEQRLGKDVKFFSDGRVQPMKTNKTF